MPCRCSSRTCQQTFGGSEMKGSDKTKTERECAAGRVAGGFEGVPNAAQAFEMFWRRVPESNRCTRICNPLRHHSANSPSHGLRCGRWCPTACPDAVSIYVPARSQAQNHRFSRVLRAAAVRRAAGWGRLSVPRTGPIRLRPLAGPRWRLRLRLRRGCGSGQSARRGRRRSPPGPEGGRWPGFSMP